MLKSPDLGADLDGEGWWGARAGRWQRTICRPASVSVPGELASEYLASRNAVNFLDRHAFPDHEQLVHVASLNRILQFLFRSGPGDRFHVRFRAITGARLPIRPPGTGLSAIDFADQVSAIAESVNRSGLGSVQSLVELLSQALSPSEPPWWAAFAQEVCPLLETEDWIGLAQALGMGHLEPGEWLIIWQYEIPLVFQSEPDARLCRPTVIEANDSPFHFPSPPGLRWGITMPLRTSGRGCLREVLHPPLRGEAARVACRESLRQLARDPLVDHNELAKLRQHHRRRLELEFRDPDTSNWLRRHGNPP